jgi:hypothetical protein
VINVHSASQSFPIRRLQEFLPPLARHPISTNTFFEELFVLLRMPYRIVPAERVVTFAGTPGVTHYNLEAASSGAPTGLEDQT